MADGAGVATRSLELGHLYQRSWPYLFLGIPAVLVYGWLVFFVPKPYVLPFAGVLLATLAIGPVLFLMSARSFAFNESGVQTPVGSVAWKDVLAYRFPEDGWLELTVVEHTANMVDNIVWLPCPAELQRDAAAFIERKAPRAEREGGSQS